MALGERLEFLGRIAKGQMRDSEGANASFENSVVPLRVRGASRSCRACTYTEPASVCVGTNLARPGAFPLESVPVKLGIVGQPVGREGMRGTPFEEHRGVADLARIREVEIGILLPNNQRQHRTLHIQKDVLPYALC